MHIEESDKTAKAQADLSLCWSSHVISVCTLWYDHCKRLVPARDKLSNTLKIEGKVAARSVQ